MRIAIVHSFYSDAMPSGENAVVGSQVDALRARGHQVHLIRRNTDEESQSQLYQVRSAFRVMTGLGASPETELEEFQPDVVHVHNLFPNFGRSWVQHTQFPIVATLHNYRTLCANGFLARKGKDCFECLNHGSHRAVVNRCYRDSAIKSIPLSVATRGGGANDSILNGASRLIVLSPVSLQNFLQVGVSPDRLRLIPNFVPDPGVPSAPDPAAPWVFVGRLSAEKGVLELVRAWPDSESLRIIGAGPLEAELRLAAAGKRVEFIGRVAHDEVPRLLAKSKGLIFSSTWSEMVALTYLEALAAGRPVLSIGPNSVSEDIKRRGTGVAINAFEDLQDGLATVRGSLAGLARIARATFEEAYSADSWLTEIEKVYQDAAGISQKPEAGLRPDES